MKGLVYSTLPMKPEVEKYLSEHCELRKWEGKDPITREELFKQLKDVEGLYTSFTTIDAELLSYAPNLKVVSNVTVGHNNFNLAAMKEKNVIGTNTPYVLDETVADLTFALMFSAARRISELDQLVKEGRWPDVQSAEELYGLDINQATIGIIGMGRIGEKVARRAKLGFNMNVLYHNRTRNEAVEKELSAQYRELESLLQAADFIVMLVPLTDETYELIGEKEFEMMKSSAIFINVSRGHTVDEKALINALQQKQIYAAGLDVFQQEPIESDNPLLSLKNVVTIPHIGSATEKTRDAMSMRAAKNIVSVLTGKGPVDQVPYE